MTQLSISVSVRALTYNDLAWCDWAGSNTHLAYVSTALSRVRQGEVEYLAVCPPSNLPLAVGGVDFALNPGAGTLWQLVVHPALRSCGLGTVLVEGCEDTIRRRGILRAELSVEWANLGAHRLYQRLGYVDCDQRSEAWDAEAPDGSVIQYRTKCIVMRKAL